MGSPGVRATPPVPLLTVFLVAGCLFAGERGLSAQPIAATTPRKIRFERISLEQGLSQASVNAILQDRVGFMWFGTQEGLNRYDGDQFVVFTHDPSDPTSLAHDWVWALEEDRHGVLWVGTDGGGLSRLDRNGESFAHFQNDPADPASLGNDRVRDIHEDRSGRLWIGTDGGGLSLFERGKEGFSRLFHNPSDPTSLSSNRIRCIYEDREGVIWIGTDGGGLNRYRLEDGSFAHFRHDPQDRRTLASDRVYSLYEDRDGALWVGTYDRGLSRFDRATEGFTHFRHDPSDPTSLSANTVRSIFQDEAGGLWIGTDSGLNSWLSEEGFRRYGHDPAEPNSLSDDRVVSIFQDRGGVLWISTYAGLNKWNPVIGSFAHYKRTSGAAPQLSNNWVTSFFEDRDGSLWVGTFGGLNRLGPARATFRHYLSNPDDATTLSDDRVMSLLVDRFGELWVGTLGGGLNRFDRADGTFIHYRHDPEEPGTLSSDGVSAILEDRKGRMWVLTYGGGLDRFRPSDGTFLHYRHEADNPAGLTSDRVVAIEEDRSGLLWIGTEGGGLNRFDPETGAFTHYRHDPDDPRSLSSDLAWSLLEDRVGNLWVGTRGAGLNRWDAADRAAGRVDFERYGKTEGLHSPVIYGVLEDDNGRLWVSTNRGLSRLDPESESFRHYDVTHGLQSNEFNFGASFQTDNGEMLFGGINGFNAFYPDRIRDNTHVPPIALTSFLKFNRPTPLAGPLADLTEIELSYKDTVVAFEFAALDFTAPAKNQYMHRLEGFDDDWVDIGSWHRATYTNLKPGDYVFRVRGSNNDGLWNEQGLSIRIAALPPPWRTWWAYLVYGAIALAALLVYMRAQAKKSERAAELARTNESLKREIEERHAKEEALRREKEKAQKYLDIVEVIVVGIDRQGRVALINQKGCRLLGYEENEILGQSWLERFVPDKSHREVRRQLKSGEGYEYSEYPLLARDGNQRIIAWHTTSLTGESGEPSLLLSSGTDITQVRQLEEQLRHAEKMEAIGTLAGGIAHDFKNILTPVLGYSMMTFEDLPPGSEAAGNVEQVIKAAERASDLVNRILTFSRQSDGGRRPLLVQTVVEEALELLRASLPATIEIRKYLDPNCRAVMADPTQIHQVAVNLCTNAYQAMLGSGGVLEVTVRPFEVDAEAKRANPQLEEGPNVELVFSDSGPGMNRATLDRIFDPFFTTKPMSEGTGLGLSVVHGIVKSHGGHISARSVPGQGSAFHIHLPCCKQLALDESVSSRPATRGRERILFVDDEVAIVQMARKMLERIGYRVTTRTSSTAALETFQNDPRGFDLIVTDHTMPDMTGLELAEEIHRIRPDIPITLASGLVDPRADPRARETNLSSWLKKPFSQSQLGKAVREALAQTTELRAVSSG